MMFDSLSDNEFLRIITLGPLTDREHRLIQIVDSFQSSDPDKTRTYDELVRDFRLSEERVAELELEVQDLKDQVEDLTSPAINKLNQRISALEQEIDRQITFKRQAQNKLKMWSTLAE